MFFFLCFFCRDSRLLTTAERQALRQEHFVAITQKRRPSSSRFDKMKESRRREPEQFIGQQCLNGLDYVFEKNEILEAKRDERARDAALTLEKQIDLFYTEERRPIPRPLLRFFERKESRRREHKKFREQDNPIGRFG